MCPLLDAARGEVNDRFGARCSYGAFERRIWEGSFRTSFEKMANKLAGLAELTSNAMVVIDVWYVVAANCLNTDESPRCGLKATGRVPFGTISRNAARSADARDARSVTSAQPLIMKLWLGQSHRHMRPQSSSASLATDEPAD